jgi:hypothetical protein
MRPVLYTARDWPARTGNSGNWKRAKIRPTSYKTSKLRAESRIES